MTEPLSPGELQSLRRFTTPTIANALERLGACRSDEGYTDPSIRCIFPDLGAVVGYACTLMIRSAAPNAAPRYSSRKPYWDHLAKYPAPRIVVSQDLDEPARGAYFGEVNSNIHRALGCVALVTNGAVRDLDEVHALGFPMFAGSISVSHAHAHLEDFDKPVTIGGLRINPGDLLHADRHGVQIIPAAFARKLIDAAREVEAYERPMIELAKSPEFSTEKLAELLKNEGV